MSIPKEKLAIKNQRHLPGAVYDEKTGAFKGYTPQSAPIQVEAGADTSVKTPPAVDPANLPPTRVRNWREDRPKSFVGRVVQDVKETVHDMKEEPGEVPFRVKERVKEYLPPAWYNYLKQRKSQ